MGRVKLHIQHQTQGAAPHHPIPHLGKCMQRGLLSPPNQSQDAATEVQPNKPGIFLEDNIEVKKAKLIRLA